MGHYDSSYEQDEKEHKEFRRMLKEKKMAKAVAFVQDKFAFTELEAREYIGFLLLDDQIRDMLK